MYSPSSTLGLKLARMYRIAAPRVAMFNAYTQIKALSGQQGFGVFSLLSSVDFAYIENLFSQPSSATNIPNNTAKFFVQKALLDIQMTNNANSMALVDIYQYDCVNDTTSTASGMWGDALNCENTNNSGTDLRLIPGVTPMQGASAMKYYWKPRRVVHAVLPAGGTHNQKLHVHCNKILSNAIDSSNFTTASYNRGWCKQLIVVVRGQPSTDGVTNTQVDLTPINLDCISTTTVTAKAVSANSTTFSYSNLIPQGTSQYIYNQGSGASVIATGI